MPVELRLYIYWKHYVPLVTITSKLKDELQLKWLEVRLERVRREMCGDNSEQGFNTLEDLFMTLGEINLKNEGARRRFYIKAICYMYRYETQILSTRRWMFSFSGFYLDDIEKIKLNLGDNFAIFSTYSYVIDHVSQLQHWGYLLLTSARTEEYVKRYIVGINCYIKPFTCPSIEDFDEYFGEIGTVQSFGDTTFHDQICERTSLLRKQVEQGVYRYKI